MEISQSIKELSREGIQHILSAAGMDISEINTRQDLETILQAAINNDEIDEIEVLIELSGE